ncbi:class I SAM-dependent methyltransferase [Treponema sp. OttesenSCG-928-L16]|nr:class I SAM-dependent methyltransferase [Treponema sp. OttesenSCG-928-L16]
MYDSLLEYYEEFFPVEQSRIDFIGASADELRKRSGSSGLIHVLDIGCATGSTIFRLTPLGMDLTGIDSNETMIRCAARRNHEWRSTTRFFHMDMMEAGKYFRGESFDMILCLGNTLVHLPDAETIRTFIVQLHSLLKKGGCFIFQLINYDRILDRHIASLPALKSPRAGMTRTYTETEDGHILFEITVNDSGGSPVFSDKTLLYPLRVSELKAMLEDAGFSEVRMLSDFTGNPLEEDSLAVTGTAWATPSKPS